ncbi:MAG: hypothetical protein LUQ13_00505 [Methanomicrobiales archaeon]|nr:hypothetical protein [Methanomicrobiales archaeon]
MYIQLEGLRLIVLQERETGKLSEIPADLFASTTRALGDLQAQVYRADDPLGPESRVLAEEIQNIQESLKDIFRIRFSKILTLALAQVDGNYADREERKRMLPEERSVFDATVEALKGCKLSLFMTAGPEGSEENRTGTPAPEHRDTAPEDREQPAASPAVSYTLVRILADVDPFMGVDGRVYQLRKGDIATVPVSNAAVLCERNIALNMNIGI